MIPVVGFNAVLMSEHFGAFFAFGVLHGALFIRYVKVRPSLKSLHSADTVSSAPYSIQSIMTALHLLWMSQAIEYGLIESCISSSIFVFESTQLALCQDWCVTVPAFCSFEANV